MNNRFPHIPDYDLWMWVFVAMLIVTCFLWITAADADVFDQWAQDHNSDTHPLTFLAPSVAKMPSPAGHMEIAKRAWDGNSGVALAIYDQGDGRILPLYIAADTNAAGKATFVAWTQEAHRMGLAIWGQAADVGFTGVGLAAGLSEANPLLASGPVMIVAAGAKLVAVPALRAHSIEWCYDGLGPVGSLGWGAATWNAAAIAGLGPIGVIPAVAAAAYTWPDDDEKFWACVPSI